MVAGTAVDPDPLSDVQVQRVHGHKRQLLDVPHTVALQDDIRVRPTRGRPPLVKALAGRTAAGSRRTWRTPSSPTRRRAGC